MKCWLKLGATSETSHAPASRLEVMLDIYPGMFVILDISFNLEGVKTLDTQTNIN